MAYSNYLGEIPDPAELRANLAKANRFTIEELAVNRSGRIADSQMVSLTAQAMRPLWAALVTFGGWLLFLLVIWEFVPGLVLRIVSLFMGKSLLAVFVLITFGCIVSILFGLVRSGSRTFRLIEDLAEGKAEWKEGRVWAARRGEDAHGLDKLHKEKMESYHYVLHNEYFEVRGMEAYEALAPQEIYRLYYAPKSKLLLSIEPVTSTGATTSSYN